MPANIKVYCRHLLSLFISCKLIQPYLSDHLNSTFKNVIFCICFVNFSFLIKKKKTLKIVLRICLLFFQLDFCLLLFWESICYVSFFISSLFAIHSIAWDYIALRMMVKLKDPFDSG